MDTQKELYYLLIFSTDGILRQWNAVLFGFLKADLFGCLAAQDGSLFKFV